MPAVRLRARRSTRRAARTAVKTVANAAPSAANAGKAKAGPRRVRPTTHRVARTVATARVAIAGAWNEAHKVLNAVKAMADRNRVRPTAKGRVATAVAANGRRMVPSAAKARTGRPMMRRAPQFNRPRQSYAAIRIDQVQRVLGEILQWTYPADSALSHWLRHHPNLGARDRSEVAEAVYDVLRHLRRYRQFGESGVGPASRRLAILGLNATLGAEALEEGMDSAEAEWLKRVWTARKPWSKR
ncbi:hypothetical protein G6F31_015267 [Rhizopus arrhizus]|nr:hypothetical protein G6F31_015267 [Rhizopus arrhizus]